VPTTLVPAQALLAPAAPLGPCVATIGGSHDGFLRCGAMMPILDVVPQQVGGVGAWHHTSYSSLWERGDKGATPLCSLIDDMNLVSLYLCDKNWSSEKSGGRNIFLS